MIIPQILTLRPIHEMALPLTDSSIAVLSQNDESKSCWAQRSICQSHWLTSLQVVSAPPFATLQYI